MTGNEPEPVTLMRKTEGAVAVIAVGFNHGHFVDSFVESLRLNAHDIGQVIFVDNGSSDSTLAEFIRSSAGGLGNSVISTVAYPRGTLLSWSLNAALQNVKQPYTACISADDFFLGDRFGRELEAMSSSPALEFVLANGIVVDERGVPTGARAHGVKEVALLRSKPEVILDRMYREVPRVFVQTGLYRTDFLRRIGGWDEKLIIDDWVLNIKAFRAIKPSQFAFIDDDVVAYRRHGRNASKRVFRQYRGQKQVIERWLPREHQAAMSGRLHWSLGDYWLSRLKIRRAKVFYGRALRAGLGFRAGIGLSMRRLAGKLGKSSIT